MDPMHPTNPPELCIWCLTLGSVVMVSCVIVDLQEVKGEGKGEGGGRGREGEGRGGRGEEGRGKGGGEGRGGKGGEGCLFSSPHNSQHVEAVNSVCTHSPQDGEE